MRDRILASFPLVDEDGVVRREIRAAVEGGVPVTYEVRADCLPYQERVGPTFDWPTERRAMNVALSNAGWGHLSYRFDTHRLDRMDVPYIRTN